VNGAIEPHRSEKTIGSSLEAAPTVYIADEATRAAAQSVDMADMCIVSDLRISADAAPADAFILDDVEGVAVVFAKATGEKCARCWKILPDVGSHSNEGVCARCDGAI